MDEDGGVHDLQRLLDTLWKRIPDPDKKSCPYNRWTMPNAFKHWLTQQYEFSHYAYDADDTHYCPCGVYIKHLCYIRYIRDFRICFYVGRVCIHRFDDKYSKFLDVLDTLFSNGISAKFISYDEGTSCYTFQATSRAHSLFKNMPILLQHFSTTNVNVDTKHLYADADGYVPPQGLLNVGQTYQVHLACKRQNRTNLGFSIIRIHSNASKNQARVDNLPPDSPKYLTTITLLPDGRARIHGGNFNVTVMNSFCKAIGIPCKFEPPNSCIMKHAQVSFAIIRTFLNDAFEEHKIAFI